MSSRLVAKYASIAFRSPDGTKIAFESRNDIYVENRYGRISNLTKGEGYNSFPNIINPPSPWSPDGTKIVFTSSRNSSDNNHCIYVMNANGTGKIALTNAFYDNMYPVWSPDGTRIAFIRQALVRSPFVKTTIGQCLLTVNITGTKEEVIAGNIKRTYSKPNYPTWLPDGKRIAFWDNFTICVVNADGTMMRTLISKRCASGFSFRTRD